MRWIILNALMGILLMGDGHASAAEPITDTPPTSNLGILMMGSLDIDITWEPYHFIFNIGFTIGVSSALPHSPKLR